MSENIVVSVICNAYKQEKYIGQCLDSIVCQKTDFPFEILVHDDASPDRTADIIREYEAKYPELIKPIYQTENKYWTHDGVGIYQYPRAKGEFIAFCEGDDYWTDENKLQKQVDALRAHPECDMCAHAAVAVDAENGNVVEVFEPYDHDTILTTDEVIMGEGGFLATNSLVYRSYLKDNMPPFRQYMSLDYTIQIHGSLRGGILYLKDNMSAYRKGVPGSWTSSYNKDIEVKRDLYTRKQHMLDLLDEDTDKKFHDTIAERKRRNDFEFAFSTKDYKTCLKAEYKDLFDKLDTVYKRSFILHGKLPHVAMVLDKVRGKK